MQTTEEPINKAIKYFKRKYANRYANYESIKQFLHSKGYKILFYETDKENDILRKYDLLDCSKNVNAFTVCKGDLKAVFINQSMTAENEIYSLLHETGHIILNHLHIDKSLVSVRLQEMQAETFAYRVLSECFKSCAYC